MDSKQFPYPITDAENTFFNLLLSGYATGRTPDVTPRFEGDLGTKRHIWQNDAGWIGIDEWRTTSLGDRSNGATSIYYNQTLIWEMTYGGSYPARTIPFLRKALLQSYIQRRWHGGRGPEMYREGNLVYYNEVHPDSDFTSFGGKEWVLETIDEKPTPVGSHQYRGGFFY